jgi:Ca-activated chloride channel family protein
MARSSDETGTEMKLKSVALLAAAGMILTSVSVYSITPSRGATASAPSEIVSGDESVPTTGAPQVDLSHFTAGSTIMVDGRIGRAKLERASGDEFILLEVTGAGSNTAKSATPVNLSIVIDRSGSMRGTRLRNAMNAATAAVNHLRDGDVVSIITFDTRTEVVVPPTTIGPGARERVASDINRIALGGDTCISCGIEEGMTELERTPGMVNRMIVLSDGDANHGVRDVPGFRSMAQRARDRGTSITTIGVDVDYNEKILTAIAQESNGHHYFVENDASLERAFEQEAESLTSTIASGAEAAIELAPGVELDRVFDRSFRRAGNQIIVPLGAFAHGDVKTVLLKVRVRPGSADTQPLANVEVAYKDLVTGSDGKCSGKLVAVLTNSAADASELDPLVASRVERTETAAALKDANALFSQGHVEEARRKLATQQLALESAAKKAKAAPSIARAADVDRDLNRQLSVINDANQAFATPPPPPVAQGAAAPAAPRPQDTRAGKAGAKQNEANALDLAF